MSGPFASQNPVQYILAQSGVSVGLAPNGTIAATGVVTLGTALPRIYSAGIWLRFPDGAVAGGLSGLYWCVMSSTTVGQVYSNFVDTSAGFVPYIPTGTLVAAVGSGVAYAQTTGVDIVLVNTPLMGNALGNNGSLRIRDLTSMNVDATANTRIRKHFLGTAVFISLGSTATSTTATILNQISNQGIANSQISQNWGMNGNSNAALLSGAIDTTINQPITLTANITNAADCAIIEAFSIEVLPS